MNLSALGSNRFVRFGCKCVGVLFFVASSIGIGYHIANSSRPDHISDSKMDNLSIGSVNYKCNLLEDGSFQYLRVEGEKYVPLSNEEANSLKLDSLRLSLDNKFD